MTNDRTVWKLVDDARECKFGDGTMVLFPFEGVYAMVKGLVERAEALEKAIHSQAMRLRVRRGQGYMPKGWPVEKVLDAEVTNTLEDEGKLEDEIERLQGQLRELQESMEWNRD